MKIRLTLCATVAACALWLSDQPAFAQWSAVPATPGNVGISTMMLLSDGTVMGQVNGGTGWLRLVPDGSGTYSSGRWTNDIAPMNHTRTYFSSAVVQSGKVFVAGGENGNGSAWVEMYDPVANAWTAIGTNYFGGIADGECVVLNNGQVLVYPQGPTGTYAGDSFLFNPYSYTWSGPIPALNPNGNVNLSEDSWVKLADDSILTIDSNQSSYGALTAERYIPSTGSWVSAGTTPVSVWANLPNGGIVGETGPGFLLPNGNAIFFGGSGHTVIYRPSDGTWIQGPDIPNGQVMGDAPGAMMPNGKILLCVGPALVDNANRADWVTPVSFYEYDYSIGATGGFTHVLAPGNVSYTLNNDITYPCRMLVLPTGNVLFTDGNQQLGSTLYVFQMDTGALASGQPAISKVQWNTDGSLHVTGTLFDGASEGAAYGDNQQMATDFPLVRFTSGGSVYYGRTYNWSSASIQTVGRVMTTEVTVPPVILDFLPGASWSLQVVANGNASVGVTFYSPVWVDFNLNSFIQNGWYAFPYYTLPQGVSAVPGGGTIAIRGDVQPSRGHETVPYTISTPMTIISVSGPSTIGN